MSSEVRVPGARYAFGVFHPASPMLRIRYRQGVAVDPHGLPDWIPYAREVVELPPLPPGTGVDVARVLAVVTANLVLADPTDPDARTTVGWTWAHLAGARRVALVPAELHAAFRHLGGISTGDADHGRRGLPVDSVDPPPIEVAERLSPEVVALVEERLGGTLPAGYRDFLTRTNGGRPGWPGVHPRFGFVVDQPFLGLARADGLQDLNYANTWWADRFPSDWLAIGHVQGGLLLVKIRGDDSGSIWYWDDDDPRARDGDSPAEVGDRLLHRCADGFGSFWHALRAVPTTLWEAAATAVAEGRAVRVDDDRIGTALPAARRAGAR
ncbi:SMI1/KNR4 family protein [Micromonospora sp. NPDC005367]|uniref:SMI1/KNR4 family protein n=1 Tax=Micromonospora sp. NPDC005367 TaxID=3155590 RepID=UPI0033BC7D48